MYPMTFHYNINLYNIIATQTPQNMHININNFIKINHLNSKSINTIYNTKKETRKKSHIHTQVCISMKSMKDIGSPPNHLFPTYAKCKIIIGTNHMWSNAMVSLPKNKHTKTIYNLTIKT